MRIRDSADFLKQEMKSKPSEEVYQRIKRQNIQVIDTAKKQEKQDYKDSNRQGESQSTPRFSSRNTYRDQHQNKGAEWGGIPSVQFRLQQFHVARPPHFLLGNHAAQLVLIEALNIFQPKKEIFWIEWNHRIQRGVVLNILIAVG